MNFDLGRKIGVGVDFFVHRHGCKLAVAQVAGLVGVVDTARDRLLVTATRKNKLAFLGLDDCRSGVLAHRQHAARGNARVFQQVEGNESIVGTGLRVLQDIGQLLQVGGSQEVGDVAHCMLGEQSDC